MKTYRCFTFAIALYVLCIAPSFCQTADFSKVPGTVIAHSPASLGQYIGSPSICILPNGDYVASHDLFGPKSSENEAGTSKVYRSKDKGKTWRQIAEVTGQFWSKLLVHRGALYFFGTSKQYGNTVIRKSTDNGKTWTTPNNKLNGLLLEGEYHCAPMPFVEHNGRLWRGMEDAMGPVRGWGTRFGSFMMSIPVDSDLLHADSWICSNVVRYDSTYLNGNFGGWLEGNAVVDTAGKIVNVLRTAYHADDSEEKAAIIRISDNGKRADFDPSTDFISFPGGAKKFTIRFDPKSRRYWTICNYVPEQFKGKNSERTRNTAALFSSPNLYDWTLHSIVLQHPDIHTSGFQYLDWQFDGEDIVAVSRTAYDDGLGGSRNQHDTNFLTFHRFQNFKKNKTY